MATESSQNTSASQVRQKLLESLLDSVKKCQVRFGGKRELATENEEVVKNLCRQLELTLGHGLKDKDTNLGIAVFRNVRELVGGGELEGKNLWNLVKSILNSQEQQRFLLLNNVSSDIGRSRAWIRSALNEKSLERCLQVLLSDKAKLESYYSDWAYLRDEERSSMLLTMVTGLSSVRFALSVDNVELNGENGLQVSQLLPNSISSFLPFKPAATPASVSQETEPTIAKDCESSDHVISTAKARAKVKKKKLKTSSQVVSFDEGSNLNSPEFAEVAEEVFPETNSNPPEDVTGQDLLGISSQRSSNTVSRRNSGSPSSFVSCYSELSRDKLSLCDSVSLNSSQKDQETDELDIYRLNSTQSQSELADTKSSDSTELHYSDALTPVTNKDVGALFPVSLCDAASQRFSSDTEAPEADNEMLGEPTNSTSTGDRLAPPHISNGNTLSETSGLSLCSGTSGSSIGKEDLKKALLSVMEKKDELENQIKAIRSSLEAEVALTQDLKSSIERSKQENAEQVDKLESKITILSRENELLKHQLKKYVGAVQKLRDGPQAYETLATLEKQNETKEIMKKYVDYHFEASEYEKKLIQVAEMHGELLEFNESLQRSVQARDAVIGRLKAELVLLRGPLPEDEDSSAGAGHDTASLSSTETGASLMGGVVPRVLVNIWIPSVFLTGTGTDRHHVYQVFVRIRDTEWNVYRRYSQFLELHHKTRKSDPALNSFHFPPKKTVGNKSEKFVENRRKLLQNYLRNLVNYMVTTHPTLSSCPDRDTLVQIVPFFCDSSPGQPANQGRRSIFRRRERSQPPVILQQGS